MRHPILLSASLLLLGLAACSHARPLDPAAGFGPDPALPPPQGPRLIPTIKVAKAMGWPAGATPVPAADLKVNAFAQGLSHPRWIYVLPNGDVLVSEASGPADKDKGAHYGIRGFFQKLLMKKAGASPPSADRISLLRDTDHDGVAETREVFISGLHAPFGIALVGNDLYVANTDGIVRFPYQDGETRIAAPGVTLTDLPGQPINHHWTKNILASPDGALLYASVGSNSNVAENGLDKEQGRAAIYQVDRSTGAKRLYASGLRNPVGMAWEPQTGALWVAVNERDELGDDLVPDYMTAAKQGGFYGWPYSYYGQHVDSRVKAQRPDLVARAIVPDYALGAHTASLGLTFYERGALPARYAGGAFVGQHGSWNRSVPNGYKVVFVPFSGGRPSGQAQDVLTGFLDAEGHARGRPVGVAVDGSGALLVADDVGNAVWRLTAR